MNEHWDPDFIDNINVASFLLDLLNYQENLTQSDKDDIMGRLDQQTTEILTQVKAELEKQNRIMGEILEKLNER